MQRERDATLDLTMPADLALTRDGIVVIRFKPGARLAFDNTEAVVVAHTAIAGGVARPLLADIRGVMSVNRAARELAGGPRVHAITTRLALLVGNAATRVIGTFFLRVTGPSFPTRVFDDEAAACSWLLEQVDRGA